MNEITISEYLTDVCNQIKTNLGNDVYSCDIYAGQLESDASEHLNFNVTSMAQVFIGIDEAVFAQGATLIGDATFAMYVVTIADPRTKGFSFQGMDITQKVAGFINNSDMFNKGTAGRPTILNIAQIVNKEKEKKLYNIFRVVYNQKIILKQNF